MCGACPFRGDMGETRYRMAQTTTTDNAKKKKSRNALLLALLLIIGFSVGVYVDFSRAKRIERGNSKTVTRNEVIAPSKKLLRGGQQALLNIKRIITAQDTFYFMHRRLAKTMDELDWNGNGRHGCIDNMDTWASRETNPQPPKELLYRTAVRPCRGVDGVVVSNGCYIISYPVEDVGDDLPIYISRIHPIITIHSFKKTWGVFLLKNRRKIDEVQNLLKSDQPLDIALYDLFSSSEGERFTDVKDLFDKIK